MITFRVDAVPVAQPRQRVALVRGRARQYLPTQHPVNAYKAACAIAASQLEQKIVLEGPIALRAVFVLPRPISQKPKVGPRLPHAKKPDGDNLAKSTLDALNGILWRDDSQISVLTVEKFIAASGEQPHAEIFLQPLSSE